MNKRKITDEMAEQIEREADDPDLWRQEPVEIEARPSRTSVLSVRLPTEEFHALLSAARAANESVSQYVRTAISLRQRHEQVAATVNVNYTYEGMPSHVVPMRWDTWTAGDAQRDLTLVQS